MKAAATPCRSSLKPFFRSLRMGVPAVTGAAVLLLCNDVSCQTADVLVPTVVSEVVGSITELLITWYGFGTAQGVKALFAAFGSDVDGEPSDRVYDNIFIVKPTVAEVALKSPKESMLDARHRTHTMEHMLTRCCGPLHHGLNP